MKIISRAMLAGAIFSFTISLGEFGATSFISRPENPTLPVAIFRYLSQPGAMNYGQAMAMSSLLILVCGLSIWLLDRTTCARAGRKLMEDSMNRLEIQIYIKSTRGNRYLNGVELFMSSPVRHYACWAAPAAARALFCASSQELNHQIQAA